MITWGVGGIIEVCLRNPEVNKEKNRIRIYSGIVSKH